MSYKLILLFLILLPIGVSANTIEIRIGNDISLVLEKGEFIKARHEIQYRDESSGTVDLIDSWLVFGTDAHLPEYVLVSAIVILDGERINLDTKGMFNPWFEHVPGKDQFKISKLSNNYLKIVGTFSSGVGSYEAEWHIVKGVSYRASILGKI